MKTTFYISAIIFGLQSNLIFAARGDAQSLYSAVIPGMTTEIIYDLPVIPVMSFPEITNLAPVTPKEADFNDSAPVPANTSVNDILLPMTPREADFSDSDADMLNLLVPVLAPSTPKEADFKDTVIAGGGEAGYLAPVIPDEANFEDIV